MESARQDFGAAVTLGCIATAIAILPVTYALAATAVIAMVLLSWWTIQTPARWLLLFFPAALLLPPVNLPIGNSGPHPSLVIAALGVFSGLLRLQDWTPKWSPVSAAMVLFTAALAATAPAAAAYSGIPVALGSLSRVALFAISVYVFLYVTQGPLRWGAIPILRVSKWLLYAATAAAAFACLDFYFQFPTPAGFGPQFVWLDTGVFRRAQGLFYEASTLGNFCTFFLVMIVVALFTPRQHRPAGIVSLILCGTVLGTALVLSYSRASLVNLAVSFSTLLILQRERLNWKALAKTLFFVVLTGVASLWILFPTFAQSYWTRLALSAEFFYSSPNGVLSGRVATWERLIDLISQDPWPALFGMGYKTLPYTDYFSGGVIVDNMYFTLLLETGILGLAAFTLLNWRVLSASRSAAGSVRPEVSFAGTWFFCFWIGELVQMLSGDLLTYWRVLPVYFLVLALAVRRQ